MKKELNAKELNLFSCDCKSNYFGNNCVHFFHDGILYHGEINNDKVIVKFRILSDYLEVKECTCDEKHKKRPAAHLRKGDFKFVHFISKGEEYHGFIRNGQKMILFKLSDIKKNKRNMLKNKKKQEEKEVKQNKFIEIKEKRKEGISLTEEEKTFLLDMMLGV